MGLTLYTKHLMLEVIPPHATHLSMHIANPGSTGSNEIHPSGNQYTRLVISSEDWQEPSNGALMLNKSFSFKGPPAGQATYLGIWENSNFMGYGKLTEDNRFNDNGVLLIKQSTRIVL